MLQVGLEEQVAACFGRAPYERHPDAPAGHRNGYGWHTVKSEAGPLTVRLQVAAERRAEHIRQLGAVLPADYLELVAQTEGLEVDGCVIYGLSEIRHIVMSDGSYWTLAECRGRGIFAVREEEVNPEICFLSYENGRPLRLGPSFRFAVERALGTPQVDP